MDLVSKVDNAYLFGKMTREYMAGTNGKVENVFELEDVFAKTVWMN
jgi:hypothetical protein